LISSIASRVDRAAAAIRHHPALRGLDAFWNVVRPVYEAFLTMFGRAGLPRNINGTDPILVSSRTRGITESYEPSVWTQAMTAVQTGDVIVDIGAFIGLYTVAFANRIGPSGQVIAFEPDPKNFETLCRHVDLNGIRGRVELHQLAVTDTDGPVPYHGDGGSEAHVSRGWGPGTTTACGITLDTAVAGRSIDILKIDVEGHEEEVLRGGTNLIADGTTAPRAIFIEVHPHAWKSSASGANLLHHLASAGYTVTDVSGGPVDRIEEYGEIIATRRGTRRAKAASTENGSIAGAEE
jgi:FkbM family methyltransferase